MSAPGPTCRTGRAGWRTAPHWQERTREVEDRLSDALHERLTQRFVDRRTSALLRSLREKGEHAARVEADGEVVVDEHSVGRLVGLGFVLAEDELESEQRLLMTAARRAVGPSLRARAGELVAEPDTAFSLGEREEILLARGGGGPAARDGRPAGAADRAAGRPHARQRHGRPGAAASAGLAAGAGSASGWQPWRR